MSSESQVRRLTNLGLSKRKLLQEIESQATRLLQAVADTQFWHDCWLEAAIKDHRAQMATADAAHQQTITQARTAYEQQTTQATQTQARQVAISEADYKQAMTSTAAAYQAILEPLFTPDYQKILNNEGIALTDWSNEGWTNWQPTAHSSSTVTRVGKVIDNRAWHKITLPASLPFIGGASLLWQFKGAARIQAMRAVQSFLLRLTATLPPAKLRFTFIDPVGLGQNVAPFMHLADYDERLVTSKAWSESQHIEQQLANLTEHMENVIQKYLRNQFATIEAYNAQAGEVAEPYRVLAVFDFPTNFSETAARRLVSIAQNGPRCGVYVVVLVDIDKIDKQPPYGFNLKELEQNATVIAWNGERFVWQDEDFKDCLLELDEPPAAQLFNEIVEKVGKAARAADKVEVPFDRMFALFEDQRRKNPEFYPGLPYAVAPDDPTTWWRGNTANDLVAQLGRLGARQIQCLELGKATNHNALLAGRVGSGKSTLLHAMIASLILNYSPDEVELYLIDFKEVEFKTYATHQLPHARVVAIQSEREFSLSVLQRLDDELQRRKELFNAVGPDTNRLDKYRAKSGQTLPRILLVVDEFQEFFAEDDTLASFSGQLLDRLARQGRAFGIHLLLGSQTLAGAYSLARSTMGQMAVRISLQCSEADSRLILADDNPAARLLARPGEGIYNAHDGMVGHNNIFQVAWLTDQARDHYLNQVAALARQSGYAATPIIFEGNAPADVQKNSLLTNLLNAPTPPPLGRKVAAWLGDPIAIKDPTAAYFRRQSGSNLLIVGQNDEQALGMLETALISLAAQYASGSARFYVVDFSAVDALHADHFKTLAEQLPVKVFYGRRRELSGLIDEIKGEVDRRLAGESGEANGAIYLLIYGLQRARDLRPEEGAGFSSFGFGSSGEEAPPASPAQQFPVILQEGPELDIHTLVWCDTVANLNRVLDRRALREFEMRVAFQMGAEDSANLIDTPAASKLGQYRALLVSEEEGRMEKFRPYGLPPAEWIEMTVQKMRKQGN